LHLVDAFDVSEAGSGVRLRFSLDVEDLNEREAEAVDDVSVVDEQRPQFKGLDKAAIA
jgi:hypothetical protein